MKRRLALTVVEAAAELQVHPRTVTKQLRKGLLPGRKVGGVCRIPRQGLMDYLYGEDART